MSGEREPFTVNYNGEDPPWFAPPTITPAERAQLVAMDAIEGEASWEAVAGELAAALEMARLALAKLGVTPTISALAERALNAYAKRAAT